uniref:Uncharacterized protein n=1 Tax=Populus trichocarpa TaxID=3694 RepID=A0A3N7G1Y5_POPTR
MIIPIKIQMIKWRGRDHHHSANRWYGIPS